VKIATPKDMPEEAAKRHVANQIRQELERDDLERNVKEAQATIAELKPLLEKANAEAAKRREASNRKPAQK